MRIVIQPTDVRAAGLAFGALRDELAQAAAAVAGTALPAMPAAMAERHQQALVGVAARLRLVAGELGRVGDELQVRAAAAELADATSADGPGAVRTLARALGHSLASDGAGLAGTQVAAAGGALSVTTAAGASFTIADRELRLAQPPVPPTRGETGQATAPAAGEPRGGLPATTVRDALAGDGGAGAVGLGPPAGAAHPQDLPLGDELRARCDDGSTPLLPAQEQPPPHTLARQVWGCWWAARAAAAGLPPTLPLIAALARSGMRNLADGADGAGLFGIDGGAAYAPPGHGLPHGEQPSADWWAEHPGAQLDYALGRFRDVGGGTRDAGLDDPDALGRWAAEASGPPASEATAFADAHAGAAALVEHCGSTAAGGDGGALAVARSQLGVRESGINAGVQVDRYLSAAGAGSGNPWCAGFVTWSVEHAGGQLPGGGWAAVSHWVAAAQAHEHGLALVDAAQARPGDVVAFDWGGGGDFGADGHIGFLDSPVAADGTFQTVEGNAGDAVAHLTRSTADANVVFIRLGG